MRNLCLILLLGAGLFQNKVLFGQAEITFSDFTLKEISAVINKKYTTAKDTFIIQRYGLTNRSGDSLILLQNMQIMTISGQVVLHDIGVTLSGNMLYKDSCYTIQYEADKDFYNNKDYIKNNRVDFIYKSKNGKVLRSNEHNSLILISATAGNCNHPLISAVYNQSFDSLSQLLLAPGKDGFKKSVFIVENAYLGNTMSYEIFDYKIKMAAAIVRQWQAFNSSRDYRYTDSVNYEKNRSLFHYLMDSTKIIADNGDTVALLPYRYNFNDFFGKKDWTNMFVSRLLVQHKGNCHSLPYLYKMLADENDASCWIGLAPNHMYIKSKNLRDGWINIELTSGTFPTDAWIMGSGYITNEAIQHGIYMDTLSNRQNIGLCFLDLAKGYERRTQNYTDGFIIKCCDKTLSLIPANAPAMLLKAEVLKQLYVSQKSQNTAVAKSTYSQMEELYVKLASLGYREMPLSMYQKWLTSVMMEGNQH